MTVIARVSLDTEKTLVRIGDAAGCVAAAVNRYALAAFARVPRHPTAYPPGQGAMRYVNLNNSKKWVVRALEGVAARYGVPLDSVVAAALSDFALAKATATTREELWELYSR